MGSLLGGWFASVCGRRTAYFLISLISLASSFYIFHSLSPLDDGFLTWVFIQGFFGTVYFGWLPFTCRSYFPRACGDGHRRRLQLGPRGDRRGRAAGRATDAHLRRRLRPRRPGDMPGLRVGMVVICFAPDTSGKGLEA